MLPEVQTHQGVVNQTQAFQQGHAHVIGQLQGRRTRSAFRTIDHDEIRQDAGADHGFGNAKPFPRVTNAQLKAHGFAFAQVAQTLHKLKQFCGCRKTAVRCRRDAVDTHGYTSCLRNFWCHFGSGQDTAMSRLGTLAQFDFNHLDLGRQGILFETFSIESTVVIATTKIARTYFPNEVATMFAVIP